MKEKLTIFEFILSSILHASVFGSGSGGLVVGNDQS
jgi:hypothetical protein